MTIPLNPLRNPKDPLHKAGPEPGRALFVHFTQLASGFPADAVLDAACNVVITAIRQQKPTWRTAEEAFDATLARAKTILRDHYDANGKRRNVFPFDQVINASLYVDPDLKK